jgi:hypothetical protein
MARIPPLLTPTELALVDQNWPSPQKACSQARRLRASAFRNAENRGWTCNV